MGQRIRPHLELDHLARGALAALHVERRTRAHGRPQTTALPATVGIVNPSVQPLGEEAEWVGYAQHDPFAVLQHEQSLRPVAGIDRDVGAEPERVELVHPRVVARFRAAGVADAAELGHGFRKSTRLNSSHQIISYAVFCLKKKKKTK